MDLLFRLTREKGLTLIYVSHHMAHAAGFSDRIVGLACGRVVLDRRSENSDERELRAFFEESEPQLEQSLIERPEAIRISA